MRRSVKCTYTFLYRLIPRARNAGSLLASIRPSSKKRHWSKFSL